jgi:AraC-like DNA-binding protein
MFVHGSRIRKQIEYLSSLGIDIQPLYKQIGLDQDSFLEPDNIFDFEVYRMVLEFALRQTNNPDYGLDFGNHFHIGGTIGMFCASCRNLKEAYSRGCNYLQLQGDYATLRFREESREVRLIYSLADSWSIGCKETARIEIDAMFSFLNTILQINSNHTLNARKVVFSYDEPENSEKHIQLFGIRPEFGGAENVMVFDSSDLMIPMKAFNPETFRLLQTYLEAEKAKLYQTTTIADQVKRVLHGSFRYQFPDIDTVAAKLMISSRTLQRKLSEEQTTYQQIVLDTKCDIAVMLLRQGSLTISEIGLILGYADVASFSRFFRKCMGVGPQEFRSRED